MAERRRRVKTGCLSCRQRRVKCDERKPSCQRCESANISCDGYRSPRRVVPHLPHRDTMEIIGSESNFVSSPTSRRPGSPLLEYLSNAEPTQRPHHRARELLGYQQYASRTVDLLFRADHLDFWRDHLLSVALDTEYVFDVVVSLGLMHRAVIMLSSPNNKWRGLDNKVVAFQIYANALKSISEECRKSERGSSETLIAVLLLLTYFEWFVGNHTAAFQHLRTAISYLQQSSTSLLPNKDVLATCITGLGLVVQIILPLPLVNFPYLGPLSPAPVLRFQNDSRGFSQDLQSLLDIVCADSNRWINIALWSSLCKTEDHLTQARLEEFQGELLRWRIEVASTLGCCEEISSFSASARVINTLPIPPKPQPFESVDAALAAVIFHAYMGRTSCLLSVAVGGDADLENTAVMHSYHILRIVEGIEQAKNKPGSIQLHYLPCNSTKIGFAPVLFLTSQFVHNAIWLQFIIEKLNFVGQEGLFNGEIYANALRLSVGKHQGPGYPVFGSYPNITSILIPGTEEKRVVAYYVRVFYPTSDDITCGKKKVIQILGRARWESSTDGGTSSVSMEFFDHNHPINGELGDRCLYLQLAAHEPIAQEWEKLLGTDVLGPHGYFAHLANLRDSLSRDLSRNLESTTMRNER